MNMLHQKFGGQATITKVIRYFYELVQADQTIKHFFASADKDQQREHQAKFIGFVLGASNTAVDSSMAKVKQALQPIHYKAVAKHLAHALAYFGIHEAHISQIIDKISPSKPLNFSEMSRYNNNNYAHLL